MEGIEQATPEPVRGGRLVLAHWSYACDTGGPYGPEMRVGGSGD